MVWKSLDLAYDRTARPDVLMIIYGFCQSMASLDLNLVRSGGLIRGSKLRDVSLVLISILSVSSACLHEASSKWESVRRTAKSALIIRKPVWNEFSCSKATGPEARWLSPSNMVWL